MSRAHWWVSCRKFTVGVTVDEARIVTEAAPIVRKFIGQPLDNLLRWARGFGGLEAVELKEKLNA